MIATTVQKKQQQQQQQQQRNIHLTRTCLINWFSSSFCRLSNKTLSLSLWSSSSLRLSSCFSSYQRYEKTRKVSCKRNIRHKNNKLRWGKLKHENMRWTVRPFIRGKTRGALNRTKTVLYNRHISSEKDASYLGTALNTCSYLILRWLLKVASYFKRNVPFVRSSTDYCASDLCSSFWKTATLG